MASIFSRIIAGEIPCYKIAEDEKNFAFMDINPVAPGHVLCVPKKEVGYLFDLEPEDYASLQMFARKVARGLGKAVPCVKVGVAVIGLEVPHAHIHLVPISKEGDLDFSHKLTLPEAEMKTLCEAISKAVAEVND